MRTPRRSRGNVSCGGGVGTWDTRTRFSAETRRAPSHALTHAVLTGLTPLIPVPLVDDLVKSYFRKRLVRSLGSSAGRLLSEEEVDALAAESGGGCLGGCLTTVLVYPLKAVFRKLFYFLEWKRAADVTSRTYHFGYLVGHALRRREGPARRRAGARAVARRLRPSAAGAHQAGSRPSAAPSASRRRARAAAGPRQTASRAPRPAVAGIGESCPKSARTSPSSRASKLHLPSPKNTSSTYARRDPPRARTRFLVTDRAGLRVCRR